MKRLISQQEINRIMAHPAFWQVLGVLCVSILCLWVIVRFWRWWVSGSDERALKRRQRRAFRAEEDAAGVLRAHGYTVISDQVEHSWTIHQNGEPFEVDLRADYLVSRGGKRYIAEVKSGMCAPSLSTAATRRQLLEYRVAYNVEGILLVDMEAVELSRVDFGDRVEGREISSRGTFLGVVMGMLVGGSVVGVYMFLYLL